MIEARHIPLHVRFFNWYSRRMIKRHFRGIRFHNRPAATDKPLLIIGNHFSWWDGFLVVYYNLLFFKKKFHVMMLEEQLSRRMFLNKAGAFSIKKNSRSSIQSLQYAGKIISNPENLLLMFPQGEIQSQHLCSFKFGKGLDIILNNAAGNHELFFLANLTEYYSDKKPSLDAWFKKVNIQGKDSKMLESEYNKFYNECVNHQNPF